MKTLITIALVFGLLIFPATPGIAGALLSIGVVAEIHHGDGSPPAVCEQLPTTVEAGTETFLMALSAAQETARLCHELSGIPHHVVISPATTRIPPR